MDEQTLQQQMDELNRKLDVVLDEIAIQRRRRQEMDDLKDDLMRVGKDLYETAVWELEEVHDYIDTGDVLYLMKKLLRNIKSLTKMFEQLENVRDFVQDFSPISRELFNDAMSKLHEMEQKGYFDFARQLQSAADNVVTSFSGDDIRALSENVVSILNTVKNVTQPEMLHAINNAVMVYNNLDLRPPEEASLFSLLKELNNPDVRRGLAVALRFLRNLGLPQQNQPLTQPPDYK
jgi:uncharacterized protein YjgD (DUF1641 family)